MGVFDFSSKAFPPSDVAVRERRRNRRVTVAFVGALSRDGEVVPASIVDLSNGGARVETPVALVVGERFILSVEGWPDTPVVVRWSGRGNAGLAFER